MLKRFSERNRAADRIRRSYLFDISRARAHEKERKRERERERERERKDLDHTGGSSFPCLTVSDNPVRGGGGDDDEGVPFARVRATNRLRGPADIH
jgi:hypothetical protein